MNGVFTRVRGTVGELEKNPEYHAKGVFNVAKAAKKTRVTKERKRLQAIFSGLDANKLSTCQALIDRAAYITVSLQDLEEELDEAGWTEPYKNGANQNGLKQSAAASVHISLTKNLNAIMKQLLELVPPAQKASRLAEMMDK